MNYSYWFIILLTAFHTANCYNILFLLTFGTKSHKIVFDSVAEELVKRGHQVTLFSSTKPSGKDGVTEIFHEDGDKILQNPNLNFFQGTNNNITMLMGRMDMLDDLAETFYRHPFIVELSKSPIDEVTKKPKFDVVVVDLIFNDYSLPIAHHMKVPNILFSPSIMFSAHAWNLDIPFPFSYNPVGMYDCHEPMTFLERTHNVMGGFILNGLFKFRSYPKLDAIVQKYLPNTPSIEDLIRNVSFVMTNNHVALNSRVPTMPYYIQVGCIHCKPSKPLPQDLEDYLQSAKDVGVVYFSLGSFTQGQSMPEEMKNKLIDAFSKLTQKVLWKFEKDIPDLPKNIRLIKWAPQQDLLAHPNLRLFISHGGGLSTSEAAYHGCPILGFPLTGDQIGNVAQAKIVGFAEYLDWRTFTSQELVDLINTMLNDNKYGERAQATSVILKDQINPPVETAVYWIEYVIRHKGADFLKSSARHLNFFQYFLIDVLASIVLFLVVVIATLCCICKWCCRRFCKSRQTKSITKKKKSK